MTLSIFAVYRVPGLNVALDFAFLLTIALTLLVIPVAKRRPVGQPLLWAEAMMAAIYVFGVFFLAYGVVPHQWLAHADSELLWRPDRIITGPKVGDKGILSYLPFQITYQTVRDIVVVLIYVFFLGLQLYMWHYWQNRGKKKVVPELPASSYGRPLVKKG